MNEVVMRIAPEVRPIAYGDAIDLLEMAEGEIEVGATTIFTTKDASGRAVVVILNNLDSEGCAQILL